MKNEMKKKDKKILKRARKISKRDSVISKLITLSIGLY